MQRQQIYIVADDDERELAAELAVPLEAAGYVVTHNGAVKVGDSIVNEAKRALAKNIPVVLCGTKAAAGSTWTQQIINAAQFSGPPRVFVVKMHPEANVSLLSLKTEVAEYWDDPARAMERLLDGLRVNFPATTSPREEPKPDSPLRGCPQFLDGPSGIAEFDFDSLRSFREELRKEVLEQYPHSLTPREFLERAGLWIDGALTLTGALLFVRHPTPATAASMVKCVEYQGATRTAKRTILTLEGPVASLIIGALNFVADRTQIGERPSAGAARSQMFYRYPMIAVREIIANSVVHRDYTRDDACVHVRLYTDRLEVSSPGNWQGRQIDSSAPHALAELEGESVKRNFQLARLLSWTRLVEGEGSGIPTAVSDCESAGAAQPTVVQKSHFVHVTLHRSQPDAHTAAPHVVIHPERSEPQPRHDVVAATLRADASTMTLTTAEGLVAHPLGDAGRGLDQLLLEVRRNREADRRDAFFEVGAALGEYCLQGAVGDALLSGLETARQRHVPFRLAVQVDVPRWAALPWETLAVPGQDRPLALSDHVELYRKQENSTVPPTTSPAGPLRILVAVASPVSEGLELMDYERELGRILDAVDPARSGHGAYVRVLNWGSLAEIRQALEQERFHVLHLSCHTAPKVLLLEDERGQVDEVDVERFVREAIPPGREVPLIVLAGGSSAYGVGQESSVPTDGSGGMAVGAADHARAGLAQGLLARGVSAVLAMTDSVTDFYATELTATMYQILARAEHPDPTTAVSQARRDVEVRRQQLPERDPRARFQEWAAPALFLAGPPTPLFDRARTSDQILGTPEAVLDEGMVVRKVGEFVGRRTELRQLLRALRDPQRAGVVIHGIGGVGKSTLAAELLHQYGTQDRLLLPVTATAVRSVDAVLETLRRHLSRYCLAEDLPENDPLRRVAVALTDASSPWRERWELIRQVVLPRVPIVLFVDNAEDLLAPSESGRELADPDLAELLTAWTTASPRTRLLVTSRHPFALPQRAHRRLVAHHLGPLSLAETRKLIWRLPGLDALSPAEQHRAYANVGGHPRALEYLDALLRGGQARFPDIAERMEAALEARGIPDPMRWLADAAGDLDTALAEAVTLAVDDVLLDPLLDRLDDLPEARRLLDGLAVYRLPVDRTGVAWQLSDLTEPPELDPDLVQRLQTVRAAWEAGRAAGTDRESPSAESIAEYETVWRELQRPPVSIDDRAERAMKRLLELGLIAPALAPQDEPGSPPAGLTVHTWTAAALRSRGGPDTLAAAHRRAAAYWQWRVDVWPQSRTDDITQLVEVRHHHHQADDIDRADAVTQHICGQLHTWGAWEWEQRLIEETLGWIPARSSSSAAYIRQLGTIALERGDLQLADEQLHASLAISEELGNRQGIAISYHQLGIIAQRRGNYQEAEEHYRAALAISEERGDRSSIASSYHQLGIVAEHRGCYEEAEVHYRAALAISEELGDRASIASSYHQLGTVALERGELQQAEEHHRASVAISEELGSRRGIAISHHQLGIIAQYRGEYQNAEERYRAALAISEELGDRSSMATTYGQLGTLRTAQERPLEGIPYTLTALALQLEMGNPPDTALYWLARQRTLIGDDAFRSALGESVGEDVVQTIMSVTEPEGGSPGD
ncbi:tetratricopeptide repeat protein [Streptomyces sp. NPDC003710]